MSRFPILLYVLTILPAATNGYMLHIGIYNANVHAGAVDDGLTFWSIKKLKRPLNDKRGDLRPNKVHGAPPSLLFITDNNTGVLPACHVIEATNNTTDVPCHHQSRPPHSTPTVTTIGYAHDGSLPIAGVPHLQHPHNLHNN